MLLSYTRKSSQNQSRSGDLVEEISGQGVGGGSRKEGGFSMALSMDYEIVTDDGDLVESMSVETVRM